MMSYMCIQIHQLRNTCKHSQYSVWLISMTNHPSAFTSASNEKVLEEVCKLFLVSDFMEICGYYLVDMFWCFSGILLNAS